MVNAMELLQNWRGMDQQNALRAAQMEQMQMQGQREAAMHPLQIQAAQMNMLAKRQAMQQDEMRRNALQQYGATGNINALAMGDPEMAAKMRMNQETLGSRERMMREQMAMRERLLAARAGGVRGAGGAGGVGPNGQRAPNGFRWTPDGNLEAIPGGPGEKEKALTDTQGNATGFGLRASRSHEILTGLEDMGVKDTGVLKSIATGAAEMAPFVGDKLGEAVGSGMNVLPGVLGGPNSQQQQTEQARRDFVNAVLRKESGAVISPSEFMNASKQYFPQPGDSEETIKNKRNNRISALEALRIQAGPGAKNIPKPARSGKDAPQGVDPKIWEAMTPEERKLWQ